MNKTINKIKVIFDTPNSKPRNKKLDLIFGIIAIGLLIAAAWMTFSFDPLAVKINKWQSSLMGNGKPGEFYPALTIFILALPPLLLLMLVKLLFLKKFRKP
jgi:hypothetical protein